DSVLPEDARIAEPISPNAHLGGRRRCARARHDVAVALVRARWRAAVEARSALARVRGRASACCFARRRRAGAGLAELCGARRTGRACDSARVGAKRAAARLTRANR